MKKGSTFNLVLSALFVALGLLLPRFVHSFGQNAGSIFLPMHIPVLLCGLICGSMYGGISGVLIVFLTSFLSGGRPPIYPVGIYMACELMAYGAVAGLLHKKFNTIISLIGAMIAGRVALGVAQFLIFSVNKSGFALGTFLISAFVTSFPGIVIQIILIPIVVTAVNKMYGDTSYGK